MFVPRALKVKRPVQAPSQVLTKKIKVDDEERNDGGNPAAPVQKEEAFEDPHLQEGTILAGGESAGVSKSSVDGDELESTSSDTEDDDDEEPVKSFKKNQRWPEPGEPVCVMCGRYGEYICDSTDNDVCSLECKAKHLVQMGMGTGADVFNKKEKNEPEVNQPQQAPGDPIGSYSYTENHFISGLMEDQVQRIKQELGIETEGRDVRRPIVEFGHCGFPAKLNENLKKAGYEAPTPIQMQMVPVGLTGRDVIASADTGSGKTMAFLLPVVVRALEVQ